MKSIPTAWHDDPYAGILLVIVLIVTFAVMLPLYLRANRAAVAAHEADQ